MKKHILSLAMVVAISILSAGCALLEPPEPTMFDIPQSQWHTLTPEQQQEVIKGYNEKQRAKAQVAPLKAAIKTADRYLTKKNKTNTTWDSHTYPNF